MGVCVFLDYEYGVDLDASLSFNSDGDLVLVKFKDNLCQAVSNRLNTVKDSLDLFYNDYGSVLLYFCGWKRKQSTLDFIRVELETCLKQDPRINDFTIDLSYSETGSVKINLRISNIMEDVEMNFVLNENGVYLEG